VRQRGGAERVGEAGSHGVYAVYLLDEQQKDIPN